MNEATRRIPWARVGVEFVVIVTGILLALGAESWWSGRQEQERVDTYLEALEDDLLADSAFYADVALPRMVRKREALDLIGPVVRGEAPVPPDTIGFLNQVGLGGLFGIPGGLSLAVTTTMDELVATGALALIDSPELRADLTDYYGSTRRIAELSSSLMPNYPRYVHGGSPAELRDERTEQDVRAWGVEQAVSRFVSPEFETVMNQEYNYMLYITRAMIAFADDVDRVLLRVRCVEGTVDACRGLSGDASLTPE